MHQIPPALLPAPLISPIPHSPQPNQSLIQRLQKPRPIRLRKWRGTSRYPVHSGAQVGHDGAGGDGSADGGGGERLAVMADDDRACLQAPVRQQYVGGNHYAAMGGLLRNPVIGGVESVRYDGPRNQGMVGNAKARIADQHDGHIAVPGDLRVRAY